MFGPGGQRLLDEMPLAPVYAVRVESLRDLIEIYDREVAMLEREIHTWLRDDKAYWAIQAIDGVGKTMAAMFMAEIGDVSRFATPDKLCSWAGLAPRHRESDTKVTRGRITKMDSTLVRWAAVEAVARYHVGEPIRDAYARIAARRGRKIARVAAARKLLTLVCYQVNANGLGLTASGGLCLTGGGLGGHRGGCPGESVAGSGRASR
jgi:transposase